MISLFLGSFFLILSCVLLIYLVYLPLVDTTKIFPTLLNMLILLAISISFLYLDSAIKKFDKTNSESNKN